MNHYRYNNHAPLPNDPPFNYDEIIHAKVTRVLERPDAAELLTKAIRKSHYNAVEPDINNSLHVQILDDVEHMDYLETKRIEKRKRRRARLRCVTSLISRSRLRKPCRASIQFFLVVSKP